MVRRLMFEIRIVMTTSTTPTSTSPSPTPRSTARHARTAGWAAGLTALLLVAVNLRLAITSASALMPALSDTGALTPVALVLVPAIPTAVFAVAGFGSARLAARVGIERAVLLGLLALTVGLALRGIAHPGVIVAGTVIATSGLAVVNVLLPAVVRSHFSGAIRPVTTAYTTVMSLGAAAAAATAVPLATLVGSPSIGLALWAIPALVGAVAWFFGMRRRTPARTTIVAGGRVDTTARRLPVGTKRLASYFALQSLSSYVVMGWLPTIATDAGIAPERAGALLGIAMLVGVPATAFFVALARSGRLVRLGFLIVGIANAAGLTGLLIAPTWAPEVWAILLGLGMCAFPMLLALIAGFGRDAAESARVSSLAQSVAYSVATLGPLGAGALNQITGSWTPVLFGMVAIAVAQAVVGFALSRATHPHG